MCLIGCKECTGDTHIECQKCRTGFYYINGVCNTFCPLGFTANSSTNNCDANASTLAIKFLPVAISGVHIESANNLKFITGSTSAFYKDTDYEANDPKAAKGRGYYFDGVASLIHLSPYSGYTSPLLTLAPVMTIQM